VKDLNTLRRSATCMACALLTFAPMSSRGGQGNSSPGNYTTRYTIRDLGVIGRAPAQPYGMSDNHLIAGGVLTDTGAAHAVVWRKGKLTDIGAPGLGGINSLATGVNESGFAVGAAQTQDFSGEDFCGFNAFGLTESNTTCVPFIWNQGTMLPLGTLGGANGYANMINGQGEVVGYAETTEPERGCAVNRFLPVRWREGSAQPQSLPLIKGDSDGVAAWINDRGQAVGATGTCGAFNVNSQFYLVEEHAVMWERGHVIDLGNLGGDGAGAGNHACSLNNRGQVVGHSNLPKDVTFHGFLWTREKRMQDLGTLDTDPASLGLGLNDAGLIVGASLDAEFTPRAFVWKDGLMTDLNTLINGDPGLYLLMAYDVNDRGEIDGFGVSSDGQLHGFVAIPSHAREDSVAGGETRPTARPKLTDEARRLMKQELAHRHHVGGWQ
jgi:probable HAF family extracellular repeat protein